ncbi:hypothetical protein FOL47_004855, partial [Perkinsus chesapeaki]
TQSKPSLSRDYSVNLIKSLTDEQRNAFEAEIQSYLDKSWWKKAPSSTKAQSGFVYPPAVTFPVCQKAHKTTRVRPCSDQRSMNKVIPKGGYDGYSIQDLLELIRCRWAPSSRMIFMDLSKAFYRCRLHSDHLITILSMGNIYISDRVLFGGTYGPAALNGCLLVLINAILSGLTGQRVRAKNTNEFLDLVPGLHILVYYDDVCVFGDPSLVTQFVELARQ